MQEKDHFLVSVKRISWNKAERDAATQGGEVTFDIFVGYVPLASQSPYPIIVYFVANYRLHLSHFRANM